MARPTIHVLVASLTPTVVLTCIKRSGGGQNVHLNAEARGGINAHLDKLRAYAAGAELRIAKETHPVPERSQVIIRYPKPVCIWHAIYVKRMV